MKAFNFTEKPITEGVASIMPAYIWSERPTGVPPRSNFTVLSRSPCNITSELARICPHLGGSHNSEGVASWY